MNSPTVYTPEQLRAEPLSNVQAGLPDGRWVAARPMGWQGLSLKARCKAAWMVFTGRWERAGMPIMSSQSCATMHQQQLATPMGSCTSPATRLVT